MVIAKADKWIVIATCLVLFVLLPGSCIVAIQTIQAPKMAAAKAAVGAAAAGLAHGQLPPHTEVEASTDRVALRNAFASHWQISHCKPAGIGFNAYEVMVRVPGDGQYNFNAHRLDGEWHVWCCGHLTESELRDRHIP
jgi:hypothetical protein